MAAMDGESKTVKMSISSDEPYLRYDWMDDEDYWEVLDHGPGGVDEERLKSGLPILYNHDRDSLLGRSVSFVNDGHKITVEAKFSESPFAQEKLGEVRTGVLIDTSVGYELVGDGICVGAKDELPIYKFHFKVFEGSLVTIPADASVGVGRQRKHLPDEKLVEIEIKSLDDIRKSEKDSQIRENNMETIPAAPTPAILPQPAVDAKKERSEAITEFKTRCKKIDDFVGAIKNEAWKAKAVEIAQKHKDGEADFISFHGELLPYLTTETKIDPPAENIRVIGERVQGSVGERFVSSKDYKSCGGRLERGKTVGLELPDCSMLGIRGKAALAQRAGFTSGDLSAVNIQVLPGIVVLGVQKLTIMDVISPGTTGAAAIIYAQENSFGTIDGVTFAAGTYPRGKATGERGLKPNWDPDLTTVTANVRKIAAVTKVPDEFMADFPAARSYIDERLPYMVDLETEFQLLYGDGLNNNLKGIMTFANVQTRAITLTSDATIAASLRQGLTDIQVNAQFEPDFFGFHPFDWETAQLLKDTNGRFLAGGPYYIPYTGGAFMELHTFWGKPVVVSTSITYGQPIAGAGKLGAQYFLREGMRIEMTNANEDDFKRNLIALRAEHRLALACYRPVAFLEFTGFPARG
jgi:HK97 family phage major capsid protein/HK97 family phage prohead protease